MALRFNPPPNWPAPPEGFNPPAGWQPDPAWGPAPEGWQLWVEDSAPDSSAGSAPQASSAADAAWAPTQAVPTGSSPVADPTGQSASAPSGDYAASAPATGSAPGASYAPGMNYAQSPTPFHNQGGAQSGPGGLPQGGPGWQPPGPGGPSGPKPIVQQWWFWLIIGVVVIALVAGCLIAILSNSGSSNNNNSHHTNDPAPTIAGPTPSSGGSGSSGGVGSTEKNPYEANETVTITANKYSTDPNASIDVTFGVVEWDATQQLKDSSSKYSWTEPPSGYVYVRVPVSVTYHGSGQFNYLDLDLDYVQNGNTTSPEDSISYEVRDEFRRQDMPRDGGTAKGYITFLMTTEQTQAKDGVWAVEALSNYNEATYIKVRTQ